MAKKYKLLRAGMTPSACIKSTELTHSLLKEMPLHELRQARGMSQLELARLLDVQQPAIAKMERRTDLYASSLRNHIEALGGKLEILARFPEGAVRITNLSSAGVPESDTQESATHEA